jgi:glucan phosphoethanolaminetransferase (alkaline phosphatase superfamily)
MLLFRRLLVAIRNEYLYQRKRLFVVSAVASVLLGALSVGLDFLLPWQSWGMVLRTLLLIPTAASIFVLGYAAVIGYCFFKAQDETWVSLRSRYSPTWRQRISMVIGALLFVMIYAITMKPGYTLTSSIIVAIVIGLFVFMRKTSLEINREELGIPDARDAALNTHLRRRSAEVRAPKEVKQRTKEEEKTQARIDKARAKLAKAEAELEAPEDAKN